MGKPKKGRKGRQEDEFSDDGDDLDPLAQAEPEKQSAAPKQAAKKGKKGKKKKDDDWEDDVAAEIEALSLENKDNDLSDGRDENDIEIRPKKKEKKKRKEVSEDEEVPAMPQSKGKKAVLASFALLGVDDSDEEMERSSEGDQSEKEIIQPVAKKKDKKKKQDWLEREDVIAMEDAEQKEEKKEAEENQTQTKKKGKKDKKKKNKGGEEDIDAILAEIESKTAPDTGLDFKDVAAMTPEQIAASLEAEYSDDDDKKKKKKNKKGAKPQQEESKAAVEDEAAEKNEEKEEGEEEESTVKTAAQKKKEKKERQKQKKLEEKTKVSKGEKQTRESVEDHEKSEEKGDEMTPPGGSETLVGDDVKAEDKEDEEEDSKKKKKKDKKKKGEKEEPKKKTSKMAKMILEQQQKLKEEEERLRKEQEEKERKLEEARLAKEEAERLAKEKKEKRKQEKAARVARQKAEGTYLTAKQKEEKRIAMAKLQAMGVKLPDSESAAKKKKPVYDNRKKTKKLEKQDSTDDKEPKLESPRADVDAAEPEVGEKADDAKDTEVDDVKDAWDASDDDVKDDWDAESEEERKEEPAKEQGKRVEKKVVKEAKKVEEEEEEDEEDEEEEEESEEELGDEESEEESSSEEEEDDRSVAEKARDRAMRRIEKRREDAEKAISLDNLRAAVVCVLGHVDTGKTKILDKLRRTNVQDNEAGGITQQIGATNVPVTAIKEQTKMCKDFVKKELKLPGLLIIDTPGHESFSNLRTRGSSLCDIAILVVDIMHGLEPQTIESINLLKARKCPFVVALNKIDRLYQWQSNPHTDVVNQLKKQKQNTKLEFEERVDQVKLQFSEQGLNVSLFHENPNPKEYISLVPTSAHTGDGMGNLIALICDLTQSHLAKRVAYSNLLQATVMEVKAIPGLGTTIDVILVNGSLQEGQTIIVPGSEGPIVTQIRGLLLPQPMKELRVKGAYDHVKEVKAAQGVKVIGKDLEKALAGLPMHVAHHPDEVDIYREELEEALEEVLKSIKLVEKGVFVQASTLGSLEALLQFLRDSEIPYAGINIGPVHRKDVMRASVMLERDVQYAVILAFDVKVEREAQEMADSLGIRIFTAEIIYHLFDAFMKYRADYKKKKQDEFKHLAVFPCKLRILPQYIFNTRDPIVLGVVVDAGFIKEGTPLCVPSKEFCYVGIVTSLEVNHKSVEKAVKGEEVCIKIENVPGETPKLYGRHFDENDLLISKISRASIDAVKDWFRDEMTKAEWKLIIDLKKLFEII